MDEHVIRELIREVEAGRLGRRQFIQGMVGLGLTAPMAARLLGSAGAAHAQPKAPAFNPDAPGRRRPAQGALVAGADAPEPALRHRHQGPRRLADLLRAARRIRPRRQPDPRARRGDARRVQNGGLDRDGMWVVWNLKKGVQWHDGKPFTADDVVFNWEYAADPATRDDHDRRDPRHRAGRQAVRRHSVKVTFKQPTPFWHRRVLRVGVPCSSRSISSRPSRAASRARRRPTSSRSAPGRTASSSSSPATRCAPSSTPATTWPTGRSSTRIEMKGGGDAASGGARRAPDRRVRLRLEHAGGGRRPPAPGAGRQGPRRDLADRRHRAHPVQLRRPGTRGRRRAVERQDPAPAPDRSRRAPGAQPPGRPRGGPGADLRPPGPGHGELSSTRPPRFALEEHALGVQRRQGHQRSWTPRAGSAAPTASGPRTASA